MAKSDGVTDLVGEHFGQGHGVPTVAICPAVVGRDLPGHDLPVPCRIALPGYAVSANREDPTTVHRVTEFVERIVEDDPVAAIASGLAFFHCFAGVVEPQRVGSYLRPGTQGCLRHRLRGSETKLDVARAVHEEWNGHAERPT